MATLFAQRREPQSLNGKMKGVARILKTGKRLANNPILQDMGDAYMSNQGPAPDIYSSNSAIGTATSGVGKLFNLLETVRWVVVCMVVIIVVAWYSYLWTTVLSWIPGVNLNVGFKCCVGHGIAMILTDSLLTYIHKKR